MEISTLYDAFGEWKQETKESTNRLNISTNLFGKSLVFSYICSMQKQKNMEENKILIYQTEDGQTLQQYL